MIERIESARVYLRPYLAGDSSSYLAAGFRNREHFSIYESGNPLNDLETESAAAELIDDFTTAWESGTAFVLGVFDQTTDDWIGQVYISSTNPDLPEFAIGFVVDVDHEGKGYMTEAVRGALGYLFDEKGAHRVRSDCAETNKRSWLLLERCGFTREGHFRENKRGADGSIRGDYQYGILRREFDGTG